MMAVRLLDAPLSRSMTGVIVASRFFSILSLMIFVAARAPALADAPQRVVSFNLCADQLVVGLADPQQIAGLSPFAADAELSVVAEQARPFPRPDQRSEATVALM